jgi:hypothetical protein
MPIWFGPEIPQNVSSNSMWTLHVLNLSVAPLDIVVDVGGEYDPARHRYDHHQRGFTEVFDAGSEAFGKIKLSSAGLVYK